MRAAVSLAALMLLAACNGQPAGPTVTASPDEAKAVNEGLVNVCQPLFAKGEKTPEDFIARMKPLGWRVNATPGAVLFFREEAWGEVRIAIPETLVAPCTISLWPGPGQAAHDPSGAIGAVDAWIKTGAPGAQREEHRQRQSDSGLVQTGWRGGGWVVLARERAPQGRTPALTIDVRKLDY